VNEPSTGAWLCPSIGICATSVFGAIKYLAPLTVALARCTRQRGPGAFYCNPRPRTAPRTRVTNWMHAKPTDRRPRPRLSPVPAPAERREQLA
jgi:hypothetical protein